MQGAYDASALDGSALEELVSLASHLVDHRGP